MNNEDTISRAALLEWAREFYQYEKQFQSAVINAPTIDPVRAAGGCYCRECKFWDDDGRCEPRENGLIREYTKPTDFCSYGEPKEAQDG